MFKKILRISICMICLGFSNVSAEVITMEGDGECQFGLGTGMNIDDAAINARELQMFSVYQMKNFSLIQSITKFS